MIDIFAIDPDLDIFAAQIVEDIFRYSAAVPGGHRWRQEHETAQRKASLAAPTEPKLPPAVEAIATRTEGLKPQGAGLKIPEPPKKQRPNLSWKDIRVTDQGWHPPHNKLLADPSGSYGIQHYPHPDPGAETWALSHRADPTLVPWHAGELVGGDFKSLDEAKAAAEAHLAEKMKTGYKLPKPPKPSKEPPVFSKQNPLGFHQSAIKKALETWQNPSGRGTREQLMKHLAGHKGAQAEADMVELNDFLKDKPNVNRQDVVDHVDRHLHTHSTSQMHEHENEGQEKWTIYDDSGNYGGTYDSEDEAEQAAQELNDQEREEHEREFSVEGNDPFYEISPDILEDMEYKKNGDDATMESSRAIRKLSNTQFSDSDEAQNAVRDYLAKYFPNTLARTDENTLADIVDEAVTHNGGGWTVNSPLSSSRHNRHFDDSYDSEDEANNAIQDYLSNYYEGGSWSYSKDEDSEDQTHFEKYTQEGPRDNYTEMHIAMPGVRGDPEKGIWASIPGNEFGKRFFTGTEQAEAWISRQTDPGSWVMEAGEKPRSETWNDGHSEFGNIENPVIRLRHDDREAGPDGKNTFFIDEIQGPSDEDQEKMPKWLNSRMYDIGLKRAITKAIQGNYDALGWTVGNEQASRYNLQNHVDRLEWRPTPNSDPMIKNFGTLVGIKDGRERVNRHINEDKLADYIGPELAEKIMESKEPEKRKRDLVVGVRNVDGSWRRVVVDRGDSNFQKIFPETNEGLEQADAFIAQNDRLEYATGNHVHFVEGPDLAIGGRGLKQLYDRDLHKRLMDIKIGGESLKSLGVKIEPSTVPNGEYNIIQDGAVAYTGTKRQCEQALAGAKTRGEQGTIEMGTSPIWLVNLTPQLREAVKKHGVSLYRRQGEPERYDARDQGLLSIIRRMPASEAVVYAAGVLSLIALRPMLLKQYSTEELSYLRGIVAQFG